MYDDDGHDLQRYLDFVKAQVLELLENYGPIAGIRLDGWSVPEADPDAFDLGGLYERIRDAQPRTLVSYEWGLTGTEDVIAPEREASDERRDRPEGIRTVRRWFPRRTTRTSSASPGGYLRAAEGRHEDEPEV